jgi:hypothetical protein
VNTGGRYEAIVLFLAVTFLSACVERVSRHDNQKTAKA